jgi:hypothetical protein
VLGGVVLLAVLAASCSSTSLDTPHDLLGQPLDLAKESFPVEATVIVQDASPRIGLDPTFRDGLSDDQWIIVGACSTGESIDASDLVEVAVVPTRAFSSDVEREMAQGAFRAAVTSCRG